MASKVLLAHKLLTRTMTAMQIRHNSSISDTINRAAFINLREFFEVDEANFGVIELRAKDRPGRSWSTDELRLKSNTDLHKLWQGCF
jgi:hypothetical protein